MKDVGFAMRNNIRARIASAAGVKVIHIQLDSVQHQRIIKQPLPSSSAADAQAPAGDTGDVRALHGALPGQTCSCVEASEYHLVDLEENTMHLGPLTTPWACL